MLTIETREAASFCKCSCCGESIRKCEKYIQVERDGKAVRGERYCVACKEYAVANNEDELARSTPADDDGESHLRAMEDYGAYRAAGCSQEYFSDRDAGYAY